MKNKRIRDFDMFYGFNHYDECTGGELKILQRKNKILNAYANAMTTFNTTKKYGNTGE